LKTLALGLYLIALALPAEACRCNVNGKAMSIEQLLKLAGKR
jgi:hypothetical protein